MTTTYTVTVQKRLTLLQTYTLTAGSEQEASRRAREHASEANAVTLQTNWRVIDVDIHPSAEEVTDFASGDRS